jgi:hypothetical protein
MCLHRITQEPRTIELAIAINVYEDYSQMERCVYLLQQLKRKYRRYYDFDTSYLGGIVNFKIYNPQLATYMSIML